MWSSRSSTSPVPQMHTYMTRGGQSGQQKSNATIWRSNYQKHFCCKSTSSSSPCVASQRAVEPERHQAARAERISPTREPEGSRCRIMMPSTAPILSNNIIHLSRCIPEVAMCPVIPTAARGRTCWINDVADRPGAGAGSRHCLQRPCGHVNTSTAGVSATGYWRTTGFQVLHSLFPLFSVLSLSSLWDTMRMLILQASGQAERTFYT
ncbi:unnamed protein product [Pleuronectes platessa]|uniref:Uncharacterized protein n=1 Tax=Pleuronectes platessa TaxID=8262 RepID=A0A9N7TMR9_PLEPL|nr:unnamed protein product [Pleuronectes platessa]